jgi:hypothetical protein
MIPFGAGAGAAETAMRAFPLLLLRAGRRGHRNEDETEQNTGKNLASPGALPP